MHGHLNVKYLCFGDRSLNGHALYESAVRNIDKTKYSHVLCAAGTEMVTAHFRAVWQHFKFLVSGHNV